MQLKNAVESEEMVGTSMEEPSRASWAPGR